MFRDIEVQDPAAVVGEYYQNEQHSESLPVGTTKKSAETLSTLATVMG